MKLCCTLPVILASASPRRKDLLTEVGISFQIIPAETAELTGGYSAPELAMKNAVLKAEAIAQNHQEALVIGSDTVVECDNEIFGKPADAEDAVRMLRALSGKKHHVITGVALRFPDHKIDFYETSNVTFKKLSDPVILEYLRLVNGMDKAGAYAIQEHSELILDHLEGSLNNVIGLPTETLCSKLLQTGIVRKISD